MAPRDFVSLYAQVDAPHASPHRVSSTGLNIFRSMPSLLPRKITSANSVIRVDAQRPSPSDHRVGIFDSINEATSRFTCVTACCFANWELTTPDCSDAAPLNYRDERITSRAGLEPARYSTVTAYGQACIVAKLVSDHLRSQLFKPAPRLPQTPLGIQHDSPAVRKLRRISGAPFFPEYHLPLAPLVQTCGLR